MSKKAHPCTELRRLTYITRENRFRGLGVGLWKNPDKMKPSKHRWCAISRIRKKRNPLRDRDQIVLVGRHPGLNHVCNVGDDRLRGLGVTRGPISHFPIDIASSPLQHLHVFQRAKIAKEALHVTWDSLTLGSINKAAKGCTLWLNYVHKGWWWRIRAHTATLFCRVSREDHTKITREDLRCHTKISVTSSYFKVIKCHSAFKCRSDNYIIVWNSSQKSLAVAEKTASNFGGYFLPHLV